MTRDADLNGVAGELWAARQSGDSVRFREMTEAQARDVLGRLLARGGDAGRAVIGWKLGLTSATQRRQLGAPRPFAAPVYAASLEPLSAASLRMPRVEVEFVGALGREGGGLRLAPEAWAVGIEVIDMHLEQWSLSYPWAVADWGLHAGAARGTPCRPPRPGEAIFLRVSIGGELTELAGEVPSLDCLEKVLDEDTRGWGRRPREGDLVWTGSLGVPIPAPPRPGVIAVEAAGWGTAHLEIVP